MALRSGREEGLLYSLSRWTDVSGKWDWFKACLDSQQMVAFDPRTSAPGVWSLAPQDTAGLVFWTKNPRNLILDQNLLSPYQVVVNVTATGWEEVERGAPGLEAAGVLLVEAAQAFKAYWRFSPIPLLPDTVVLDRFTRLLQYAAIGGYTQVFTSFLQPNDKLPETRNHSDRLSLLNAMTEVAEPMGVQVVLCADDHSFDQVDSRFFQLGACVPPMDFKDGSQMRLERCGCAMMVDPFTINESCQYGCVYCYAGDLSLSPRKRNTMRKHLEVVR